MDNFSGIAEKLNVERKQSLSNPARYGFRLNKKGLMQKTIPADICLRTANGIKPLGRGTICYADQDPNVDNPQAELVRGNVWKVHQVAQLWVFIKDMVVHLAQIDPTGIRELRRGFITENGQVIIDEK